MIFFKFDYVCFYRKTIQTLHLFAVKDFWLNKYSVFAIKFLTKKYNTKKKMGMLQDHQKLRAILLNY